MSNKEYQGEPIDASWQSDLRDAQQPSGETIGASDDGESGEMTTSNWPSALPEREFDRGKSSGADQQSRIIRKLVQHPNASNKRIVGLADGRVPAYVKAVKHKASVFAHPSEVPFDIPETPDAEQTLLKGQMRRLLQHPDSRFDLSDFDLETDSSDVASERVQEIDGSEVCRRRFVKGEDPKTVADELGITTSQVGGYASAWYSTEQHEHAEMKAWPVDLPERALPKAQTEAFEYWLRNPEAETSEIADAVGTTRRTVVRVPHRIKCYTDDSSALPFDLPPRPAKTTPEFALEAWRERADGDPDGEPVRAEIEPGDDITQPDSSDNEGTRGERGSKEAQPETTDDRTQERLQALSENVQSLDSAASERLAVVEDQIDTIARRQEASAWERLKWWVFGAPEVSADE